MKKAGLIFFLVFIALTSGAQKKDSTVAPSRPDTVTVGIYITSIHDIDFKQKEYNVNFWVWFKYKRREFNFLDNLEIPNAKNFTKAYATIDSSGDKVYLLMKMQCTMKDSWKITNFPFDRQKLRIFFENSLYDSSALVFKEDKRGDHYDKRFAINGWKIDSFEVVAGRKEYKTGFGDDNLAQPRVVYSNMRIRIGITRDATGLFWKIFLGMYIAFLIAYVCFYIHADGIESRFGLSVGSIFAVIGNKYIIDSALPESTSFTLVDTLHGLTLLYILIVISATAITMRYIKRNQHKKAQRFDMIVAQTTLGLYLIANIYFIYQASKSG